MAVSSEFTSGTVLPRDKSVSLIFGRTAPLLYCEDDAVLDRQEIQQLIDDESHRLDLPADFLEAHFVEWRRRRNPALLCILEDEDAPPRFERAPDARHHGF